MNNIIVTGGSGQLGQCLQKVVATAEQSYQYIFLSSKDLDLCNPAQVKAVFDQYQPSWCINCAAYTAVDLAEDEQAAAFELNQHAAGRLAQACADYGTTLIHVSTDFVFDGTSSKPLRESDPAKPVNVYGLSKLRGEESIAAVLPAHFILRTSWLYSEKANNFCKTMLKLSHSRNQVQVIFDQVGTPTYAMDLARCIVHIVQSGLAAYGTYHYSNEGVASWYDFAKAIFEMAEVEMEVLPVHSATFNSKATRPHYSVLDKTKIKEAFGISIPYWRDSLNYCINHI